MYLGLLLAIAIGAPLAGALSSRLPTGPAAVARRAIAGTGLGAAAAVAAAVAVWADPGSGSVWGGAGTGMGAQLGWGFDRLGALLAVFALGMALLVQAYARRSLAAEPLGERFFAPSAAVAASVVALATATGWAAVAVSWVGVSVAAVAVLTHDGRPGSRVAGRTARRTFLIGDLALLAVAVAVVAGGWPTGAVGAALLGALVVLAAATRGALPPFQGWLAQSVAASTPVSALLHAGVVNGGGILLVRSAGEVFGSPAAVGLALVLGLGAVVVGVGVMRTRSDVKGGLVWSTVAQMGFMVLQCALGLTGLAIVHLMGHGMFKAHLFLGSGTTVAAGVDARGRRNSPASGAAAAARWGLAGVAAAGVVTAAVASVSPNLLDEPAGWVPVVVLWVLVAQAFGAWAVDTRRVAELVFGLAAVAVATWVALWGVQALKDWMAPALPTVSEAPAAVVAGVLAVLLLSGLAGLVVHRRSLRPADRVGLADRLWVWSASTAASPIHTVHAAAHGTLAQRGVA